LTDLSGYAEKSTANGDTRSGLRLRLRIAVPGRAADADPPDSARSNRGGTSNTSKQTYAVVQLPAHGRGPDQFGCLNSIWVRESGWNERAGHPASAYGIPQADPVRHPVPGLGLRAGPQVLPAAASRCSWG